MSCLVICSRSAVIFILVWALWRSKALRARCGRSVSRPAHARIGNSRVQGLELARARIHPVVRGFTVRPGSPPGQGPRALVFETRACKDWKLAHARIRPVMRGFPVGNEAPRARALRPWIFVGYPPARIRRPRQGTVSRYLWNFVKFLFWSRSGVT